jgi:hypothetical protein
LHGATHNNHNTGRSVYHAGNSGNIFVRTVQNLNLNWKTPQNCWYLPYQVRLP